MASGVEHYRKAERLLAQVSESLDEIEVINSMIAEAQVHATLALAAAQTDSAVLL